MKNKNTKPKIIVICGQTGSGKTNLAVELCRKFGGEIVNADSRQVYRGMDIGTGKGLDKNYKLQITNYKQISNNKFQTIQGIPVHLVNVVNPNKRYSVGRFKKEAEEMIADIISRGKVPFVVGGTGLYIDALVNNFQISNVKFPMSNQCQISNDKMNPAFCRGAVPAPEIEGKELSELIKLLGKLDPDALNIVDLKNKRRIERALEYCLTTGKKFSESRKKGERKYEVLKIAPKIDREALHKKIDQRVEEMIEKGLVDEVKRLVKKYGWESEAMTGIGYKEWRVRHSISDFQSSIEVEDKLPISNKIPNDKSQISQDTENIIAEIKKDTRQYAKRQITWFKRDKEINWVSGVKQAGKLAKDFLTK